MMGTKYSPDRKKYLLFKILGFVFCILPPLAITIIKYPLWSKSEGASLSIVSIILIVLCCIPFKKYLQKVWKNPSAWQMWTVIFVADIILENISQMTKAVSLAGIVGSIIGAIMFQISKRYRSEEPNCGLTGTEQE